ncbi:MAG: diguanylate cyclase (GGDEF)-like protein/PAS domain S-box-containing protein [Candidatus Endobugula sp.]|jgi:diguanylate cyclase (GGDEF)-like protein/PAS domain S-box-containing protein
MKGVEYSGRRYSVDKRSDVMNTPDTRSGNSDEFYSRFLFDTLRTAVLYLDQWGRVRSANDMAKRLLDDPYLSGKTSLEVLSYWENPINTHQEILRVARTGSSVTELVERVVINGQERWFQTDKIAVENASHGFNGVVFTLDDITELKQHQLSLAKSEANYRAFIQNSNDAIWRIDIIQPIKLPTQNTFDDARNDVVDAINRQAMMGDYNHVFHQLYQLDSSTSFDGRLFCDVPIKDKLLSVEEFVDNHFHIDNKETSFLTEDGKCHYIKLSVQGIIEDNYLVGIWGVTHDITERRQYIEQLEYKNTHDLLTGLPNRTLLQQSVERAIDLLPPDEKLVFMIIDLDSFKDVNDTLGHSVGDKIIQEIGPRLQEVLSNAPSTVARLGGDEFAIMLTEVKSLAEIDAVGRLLLSCIRQYFYVDDIEVEIRASVGVAMYPDQADDFSTLLRYADVAMYCAKEDMSGVAFYDPERDAHSPKRLSLMSELGKAIRGSDLTLYFQPKIALDDQRIVGVEALSRWVHPTMGFISPAEFVPIAEMTDLINDMTCWVLNESLRQIKEWREQGLVISVAVNVSARNLVQENFCETVRETLKRYDLPASCLELEITESTIMKNMEKTLLVLNELNEMGIDLSIDDFGTGYSSLAYLKRLPVKRLKIDYSFIINMIENEQDQVIVSSTINMAHNLGLGVVAEGIETQALQARLGEMGCEQAQGFHIGRPMPAKELKAWCHNFERERMSSNS